MQLAAGNARIDNLIQRIEDKTECFQNRAETVTNLLEICEENRVKILDLIKEAKKEGLSTRMASKLEDKVGRPYVLFLHNL